MTTSFDLLTASPFLTFAQKSNTFKSDSHTTNQNELSLYLIPLVVRIKVAVVIFQFQFNVIFLQFSFEDAYVFFVTVHTLHQALIFLDKSSHRLPIKRECEHGE
jgi:hypothetical protein